MDNTRWLRLFQPFTAVKDLYLCEEPALYVVRALQELTVQRSTEVLPALQSIFIRGHQPSGVLHESTEPFIAARQLFGRD